MIEIHRLKVVKSDRAICDVPELSVGETSPVAIVGTNGSGKTTLLRVMAGLERDFQGTCDIRVPVQERVFVHQSPWLFRGTVAGNMRFGLAARGIPFDIQYQTVDEWLSHMGIGDLADTSVDRLSGGEARRVALARAIALRPRMLLLDEPFAELDDDGSQRLISAIQELPESTVVIASPVGVPPQLNATIVPLTAPAQLPTSGN